MTVYYCNGATGSNTAPYDTWAKAAAKLSTIAAIPWVAGDIVYVNSLTAEGVDTTYAFPNWSDGTNPVQIICTNDTANAPPTTLGTASLDDSATAGVDYTFNGYGYIYGLTIKNGGAATLASINFCITDDDFIQLENCTVHIANTAASSRASFGGLNIQVRFTSRNTTWIFSSTSQGLSASMPLEFTGDTFCGTGSVPTTLFSAGNGVTVTRLIGCNLANCSGNLVVGQMTSPANYEFYGCKLHASATPLATPSNPSGSEVWLFDCNSGDVHYSLAHYSYVGSTVLSTSIYATAGATADGSQHYSWVVAGNTKACFAFPYRSPYINLYNADVATSITPKFELIRDGSTTAYKDDEVWAEWTYKGATGFPLLVTASDRRGLVATAANQGAGALGAADWTGETTPWYGKIDSGSAFTPAEVGYISGRICVSTSITVYVDPQIRLS